MGEQIEKEIEFNNVMRAYKEEAMKILVDAFNEGYLLGQKHAQKVFGGEHED